MDQRLQTIMDFAKKLTLEFGVIIIGALPMFLDGVAISQYKGTIFILATLVAVLSAINKTKDDHRLRSLFEGKNKTAKMLEKSHILIKQHQKSLDSKNKFLEEQNSLIARLIKEGLIDEKRIYEIVQSDRFFYLFCYQNVPEQEKVSKILKEPDFRNPSLVAVEEIGFIKVGVRSNFYVLPYGRLPPSLRDTLKLEELLKKLVNEQWSEFLGKLKNADSKFYKQYLVTNAKETANPTNCSYIIAATNFRDAAIDFIGYNSFSKEFKKMLSYEINLKKLKQEISKRKHAVSRFITSISYELLLSEVSNAKDKETILANEDKIREKLRAKKITDYMDRQSELAEALGQYLNKKKAKDYAVLMAEKSRRYNDLLSTIGIIL